MPCADFLMVTAASPARKPDGILNNSMNCWFVKCAWRQLLKRSIQLLILCFVTLLVPFRAAKLEKTLERKKKSLKKPYLRKSIKEKTMKIVSYNVNGIRSALNKGLLQWIDAYQPDVLCFQELKATPDQIPVMDFEMMGYHPY